MDRSFQFSEQETVLVMIHFSSNKSIMFFPLQLLISLFYIQQVQARTLEQPSEDIYTPNFMELIDSHGRAAEWHNVTTEDGYILTVFRIIPKPKQNSSGCQQVGKKRVVFVQHGLVGAADFFILFGPNRSLAYALSDAGYDVWLGNFRGNAYNIRHQSLLTKDSRFWNFSMDELALQDLPAMIDYVLEVTRQTSLTYVGHSSACTAVMILLADRPDYNEKINLNVMFAPIAFWKYMDTVLRLFTLPFHTAKRIIPSGAAEIVPRIIGVKLMFERTCYESDFRLELCFFLVDLIGGKDHEQLDRKTISTFLKYYPAGTSLKIFYHFIQHVDSGKFRHYDYENPTRNLKFYGQAEPPEYNLTRITTPSSIFWAPNDPLSNKKNVELLIRGLRNSPMNYEIIKDQKFNHIDFIVAKDAKKLLYDPFIKSLIKIHGPQCQKI